MLCMCVTYIFTPMKDADDDLQQGRTLSSLLYVALCIHPVFLPLRRPGLESITDRVTLSDYEARRLLNALVKEFIQMTAEELEQASEGNR